MMTPLISIVVNNYNYAEFVARAIDSALAQPPELCEVIVVDDGSTDDSRGIIDGYASQVQLIYKENGGQGSAFNAGYKAANGEIIIFLDSDDLLLPNAAEELAKLHATGADWVKAVWQMKEIDQNGKLRNALTPAHPPDHGDLCQRVVTGGPLCFHSAPTSGNAWRLSYLQKVMPLPESDYPRGADGYLIMLAPIYGLIYRVCKPLSCYRVHGTNFLASKSEFEKMETLKKRYIPARRILKEHLKKLHIDHDPEQWHHAHWDQLTKLATELRANIPKTASLILVDEDILNMGAGVYGRKRHHLLGDENTYHGPPATSDDAIAQIKERYEQGVRYVAFVWYAFWWLDYYTELYEWLEQHGKRTVNSNCCVIYELSKRASW